jgi:signal transduction histidine kinase
LHVRDDGRGADINVVTAALTKSSGHFGLRSIRAAARTVGGYVGIVEGPLGRGMDVYAVVPFEAARIGS